MKGISAWFCLIAACCSVIVPQTLASSNGAVYNCGLLKTFDQCLMSNLDIACKLVEHHGRCECVPVDSAMADLKACVGDNPNKSTSNTNEIVIAVIVGATILFCVCCVCLILLQPFSTGAKMSVETQPLMPQNYVSNDINGHTQVNAQPIISYQPVPVAYNNAPSYQPAFTTNADQGFYFQQQPGMPVPQQA